MDHVVYLDAKAKELDLLLSNNKSMIIRGATGRKLPYGRVNVDDILYFINNNAEGVVKAKAIVISVFNSGKMTSSESKALVNNNRAKLQLTDNQFKKWGGKRFLVLIELDKAQAITPFTIDKREFGNMDDWLLVENINKVRK